MTKKHQIFKVELLLSQQFEDQKALVKPKMCTMTSEISAVKSHQPRSRSAKSKTTHPGEFGDGLYFTERGPVLVNDKKTKLLYFGMKKPVSVAP